MRNIYPHYDPLNEFEGDYIYDGLEWGCNGEYIGGPLNNEWTEGNKHGAAATRRIITQAGQSEMNLNEKPRSAAEYCYNKNKRNANGAVQGMSNSSGWFLPGISQLESILTSYYNTYTEFQNNFYWSSAAAKIEQEYGLRISIQRAPAMPVPPRPCQTVVMQKVIGTIYTRMITALPVKHPASIDLSASVQPTYRPVA